MMQKSGKNILRIFNGDCACDAWKKVTGGREDHLVWRETYLEGPLPADGSLEDFERTRAEFLHSIVPEYPEEKLYQFLLSLDRKILSLTAQDSVLLYFDCCMYDMVMLARIMFLLQKSPAKVFLFCEDAVLGNEKELYTRPLNAFQQVTAKEIAIFAAAWQAILQGPAAVEKFNLADTAATLPHLARAMRRYSADHPADGSLGKSHQILRDLVCTEQLHSFPEIFRTFNAREQYPFLGDTACRRMLDTLVEQEILQNTGSADKPCYHGV